MLRNWSPVIYVLLPLTFIFINEADGVSCKFCQSINNYNNCISSAGVIECNDAIVNMTHLLLNPHNPTLGKVPAASQYQCFQVNYTTNGVWNYHMGCSFAGSHICEGWKVLSQCMVSNGIVGKLPDKPTPKSATSSVTPNGASKSFGGKASTQAVTKHSPPSGSSTTVLSVVVQSNSSSVRSTLSPKITPSTKDSNIRKTPSKASVFSLHFEVLAIFWIVILFWRH